MQGTQPKAFVFVLMPFDEAFRDTDQLGIKPAGDVAGAYGERVDEQIFQESILERIFNQIAKADLIISDMTGRTPNVFYETGYAHALGKKVILLTQRSEDIPFDLKYYPHIIYGGSIVSLKEERERRVRW
jgi:nucleoside 2-deoxyribosyltransferase